MAGKLPDRPMCDRHPFSQLQRNGECFLCEGEKLAGGDRERQRKSAMRFNFKGGRRRSRQELPDAADFEDDDELDQAGGLHP